MGLFTPKMTRQQIEDRLSEINAELGGDVFPSDEMNQAMETIKANEGDTGAIKTSLKAQGISDPVKLVKDQFSDIARLGKLHREKARLEKQLRKLTST
ncbi:hypothetical protein ODZ83_10950 [Acaricomes phytoseiuli]|uniref:hypothetical protein n=1 Tax=Acaricomes phytoseiuli TaxID=291968 RepID=UPI0003A9FA5E|nr:hypothetical protein [Acaricomes phytoseiuli]MCW1250679.1 hypothetical protein [Acaricomes phytoseiuli]